MSRKQCLHFGIFIWQSGHRCRISPPVPPVAARRRGHQCWLSCRPEPPVAARRRWALVPACAARAAPCRPSRCSVMRCTRDALSYAQGSNPSQQNTTRGTCAGRCARVVNLTNFLNFCARRRPHQRLHHHGDHVPHRQMDIIIVIVVAIICCVIGRAHVISSSPPPSSSSLSSHSLSTSSCYRARPSHRPALECPRASATLETR